MRFGGGRGIVRHGGHRVELGRVDVEVDVGARAGEHIRCYICAVLLR